MADRDRNEAPLAPGHWRVTAQPLSSSGAAAPAPGAIAPAAAPAAHMAAFVPPAPAKGGGHPLVATLVCTILLGFSFIGGITNPAAMRDGAAQNIGYILGGAIFGAILWAIAFAVTIRKASPAWKYGSLALITILGGLVAVSHLVAGSLAEPPNTTVPPVRIGK